MSPPICSPCCSTNQIPLHDQAFFDQQNHRGGVPTHGNLSAADYQDAIGLEERYLSTGYPVSWTVSSVTGQAPEGMISPLSSQSALQTQHQCCSSRNSNFKHDISAGR